MQRRTLFRLHNATGLAAALVLVLSALTGGMLVFRGALHVEPPSAPIVEQHLALEQIVAAAEREGGAPVTDLGLPQAPEEPYHAWLDDDAETELWLDGQGRVLARHEAASSLTRWLFRLHTGELLGPFGQALMLLAALALCGLAWTGVGMWMSRRRARR